MTKDVKELVIRHNAQKFIKRTVLDIELLDGGDRLKLIDLKREFVNIDEPRDKRQFGKITIENKEIIDGGISSNLRASSWFIPKILSQRRQSVSI